MAKNKEKELLSEELVEPVEPVGDKTITPEPVTVDEMQKMYPEQIKQIKDETIAFVNNRTVSQIKEMMPGLYERIAAEIKGRGGPDLNVKGFLLGIDDPFAAGTLRAYQKLKGLDGLRLPYVLPLKDRQTPEALANYILRAEGAGDTARAIIARKELLKLAPEYFKKKTVNVQKNK